MTHDLWSSLNTKILDYLAGVSLADMVETQTSGKKVTITPRANHVCNEKGSAIEAAVA
jgi:Rrf2 family iron-sulfur cluster assembly transcriptional regulator